MRIAIVNDVIMAIEAVRRVIIGSREHQIAWIALNGAEAVQRCGEDTPDLILMDIAMPKMDGIEATRRIMARTPCAIVVVTANVDDNPSKVFEAMGAGALDAVNTPVLKHGGNSDGGSVLLSKIETIRKLIGIGTGRKNGATLQRHGNRTHQQECLLAFGASAGGPAALAEVLSSLPSDFQASIVVVQHVDAYFAQGLADWLNGQSPLNVRLANQDDNPEAGEVLLAGGENHLVFEGPHRLGYTRFPVDCSYRPSVDVFFRSIDRFWKGDVIGVILTGMGRDGAEGLRILHAKGHYTIAQDKGSSAVYGMPKAAAELKATTDILPLSSIGPRLAQLVTQRIRTHA
jgi:two-component system response regulator WspF